MLEPSIRGTGAGSLEFSRVAAMSLVSPFFNSAWDNENIPGSPHKTTAETLSMIVIGNCFIAALVIKAPWEKPAMTI